jgi:hypothetical protein
MSGLSFNATTNPAVSKAQNVVYINSINDFPTPSAGVITLDANTKYILNTQIVTSNRFVVPTGSSNEFDSIYNDDALFIYTGADVFFTSTNPETVRFKNLDIQNTGSGSLFNISGDTGTILIMDFGTLAGWGSLGTISGGYLLTMNKFVFAENAAGLMVDNFVVTQISSLLCQNSIDSGEVFLSFAGATQTDVIDLSNSIAYTQPNEDFIFVDPAIKNTAAINIKENSNRGSGDFFKSGATGSITAFADAGGGQITVTSATHGLSNGQTILITGTQDYDGGYTISNVATNTFEITATFVTTETGTWDIGSLTEKDPRMNLRGNPGQKDSQVIGSFNVVDNTTATTITTQDEWTNVNFNALASESSNIERFKLTNTTTGELEYEGVEDFSGEFIVTISAQSAGATQEFWWRLVKNGSPFSDSIVAARSTAGATGSITLSVPVTLTNGDKIRMQVLNHEGTSNIIHRFISAITI